MKPLISIIVPIYNVECYLERCIKSIVEQTYENLEIILIDDGSTDCGPIICDNWSKHDERIKVIHQENKGISATRNCGLDLANGDLIAFIDSDDYVSPMYIEYLYSLLMENNAEISVCSFYIEYEHCKDNLGVGGNQLKIFNNIQAIESMFYDRDFYTAPWGKLYKKYLFENIRYPEGRIYEDLATTYRVLYLARNIVYGPERLYFYYQSKESIMRDKFKERNLDLLFVADEIQNNILKNYPELIEPMIYRVQCAYFDFINMICDGHVYKEYKSEVRYAVQKLKKNNKMFIRNRKILLRDKLLCLSVYGGYKTYYIIYNLKKYIKKMAHHHLW